MMTASATPNQTSENSASGNDTSMVKNRHIIIALVAATPLAILLFKGLWVEAALLVALLPIVELAIVAIFPNVGRQSPERGSDGGGSKIFWRIFFWCCLTANVLAVSLFATLGGYTATIGNATLLWVVIACVAIAITLIGVFGYAYDKALLTPRFWKAVWLLTAGGVFLYVGSKIFIANDVQMASPRSDELIFDFAVLAIFWLPPLVALYLYAWRSESLWTRSPKVG